MQQVQWKDAIDLSIGQYLRTSAGTWIQLTSINVGIHRTTVYNLNVDVDHTYFVAVGETDFLVHNCNVALGHSWKGLEAWADENGYTHFMNAPVDEWHNMVWSAINDEDVHLHIRLDGFTGATPEEMFENAYQTGIGNNPYGALPNATEEEMEVVGKAIRFGNRSWDSITFYLNDEVVTFNQPDYLPSPPPD